MCKKNSWPLSSSKDGTAVRTRGEVLLENTYESVSKIVGRDFDDKGECHLRTIRFLMWINGHEMQFWGSYLNIYIYKNS